MIRTILGLGAALLMVTAACSSGAGSSSTPTSPTATASPSDTGQSVAGCSPARPRSAGDFDEIIESGGVARTYRLHVPATYDGTRRVPLVLALHPFAGNATFFMAHASFATVSDSTATIIAAPNGLGQPQFWNYDNFGGASNDVTFLRDLLAKLDDGFCIDPDRIFAAGYSNGGGMALRLACDMPERIAAVGVAASLYPHCQGSAPVIAFHGTADAVVPFEGGAGSISPGLVFGPVRRSMSEWARGLGCDGLPQISRASASVELSTFVRCKYGDGEALLYTVVGGGHSWPGANPALAESIVGVTTQEISATSMIWSFFVAHPHGH